VGMQQIPIVYGMTPGEYAQMLKGEGWFKDAKKLNLTIIKCKSWDHNSKYNLPVAPSPNLKSANAVTLYPSLCFFEGTIVSVGRGTKIPFEQWGNPAFEGKSKYFFKPASVVGATNPPFEGKVCYGEDLSNNAAAPFLNLSYLIKAYNWYPEKEKFFNSFFEKLAGTTQLRKQIESGMKEDAIRKSWQPQLDAFKKIRKNYLLYTDFK